MNRRQNQVLRFEEPSPHDTNIALPHTSSTDSLPDIANDNSSKLDELLRKYRIDGEKERFWTTELLRRILTEERVLAELRGCLSSSASNLQRFADLICADPRNTESQTYLKVFSILLLVGKPGEIGKFVDAQLCDDKLPVVVLDAVEASLCLGTAPKEPLRTFAPWKISERELFESTQWQVLVPVFERNADKTFKDYDLPPQTILPWCKRSKQHQISASQSGRVGQGAFAEVSLVRIHPTAHAFHNILREINLEGRVFAVKKLSKRDCNNQAKFRQELNQLMRFSGLVHSHLVTLLCTFTFRDQYHFIFPLANCDLEEFWNETELSWDVSTARWASKQLLGIMGALDTIHNPNHLTHDPEKRFGRHGDIKSDNILCFTSNNASKDKILVISDFGLSSFNRYISRSNIPNKAVPPVPGYRPPECDLLGGTVSRAFDIWTMGCLYLEFVTWLLGGKKYRKDFERQRTTQYITGANNDIFFALKKTENQRGHVAQVKPEVTNWINALRQDPKCSKFILDVLDIVTVQQITD
ncbi:hypothetical protein QQZ08_009100 [Neonectria magnoliae]|uniref:Protein kinase domain-containing protein n=1 Tax=Neonectria magnoliae TaxID=2732573 RepID=A0ABR1HRI6_9HYPO